MPAFTTSPRRRRGPGRLLVGALGLTLVAGLVQAPVAGDEIDDTRSEAARIADRIEDLQHDAEVKTEEYLDAKLAREQLDAQIAEAAERSERSGAQLESLQGEVRDVALESYMADGSTSEASGIIGSGDARDVSRRRGYAESVGSDSDDLLDELRGAEAKAEADARTLEELQAEAAETEAQITRSKDETESRLTELRDLEDEVQGQLAELVQAEQDRRDRQAAARAAAAQAEAEAEAAAQAAAAPAPDAPLADAPTPVAPAADPAPAPTAAPAPTPAPAPSPAPAPAPGPQSGAQAAIAAARSVIGTPYQWGGASPSQGFDCSGLVLWAWQHGGKSLPHSSKALYSMSAKIPVSQLQPGDLVFYNSPISHVGLYIGGGQMIHAPHSGSTVHIVSIYYWSALVGGGRI